MIGSILDMLLAATMLGLAWRVLETPDMFEAVVVFIVLGLLMAVAWARLSAPDIALAEAAISAGLVGVLLLDTLRALTAGGEEASPSSGAEGADWVAAAATALLAGTLVVAVMALPAGPVGLKAEVATALPESGVSQPVTAVLLNFRGYDTWLELGVLLIAVIGVLSLRGAVRLTDPPPGDAGPVLSWLVRVLVPTMVLVAGYLLWLGKTAAGGAFQAGVVLGAAGVLLWLGGRRPIVSEGLWKVLLPLGFSAFLAVAVSLMSAGRLFLDFPPEQAGILILSMETAAAISIGATMTALFIGLHFPPGNQPPSTS
ncbi:MAG: hydrogenase subunit MbhD domain-containing protein [Verrucomicrobiales bacterium]